MSYCCQQDDRRDAVRRMTGRNGLDYVEVAADQMSLQAYFLGKLPPQLARKIDGPVPWLRIEGGVRVTEIAITGVEAKIADPGHDDSLIIRLDKFGDFSTYTLRLVGVENIDPHYDHVDFSFKIDCPSDLDCQPVCTCAPVVPEEPEINYLAKDYQSFRQLILDRLAVLMPDWRESHAADLNMTLVELLAYVGDQLSYYQDAVATEAYLDTARQRISVRRHGRLVDYRLHEGCNARAWVAIESDVDFPLPAGAFFVTRIQDTGVADKALLNHDLFGKFDAATYEVFEPIAECQVRAAHSEIAFYTGGGAACCIEKGSTSATLLDSWLDGAASADEHAPGTLASPDRALRLQAGDVLIFEERVGPKTGLAADADPTRRHAVRLTKVTPDTDPLFPDARGRATPVLGIEWAAEDALPFTLCLSALGPAPACSYLSKISVARGNVVLVDHGRSLLPEEDLGGVPGTSSEAVCHCVGMPSEVRVGAGSFRPRLNRGGLTYRQPLRGDDPATGAWTPAAALLTQEVREALAQVKLTSRVGEREFREWRVVYDLRDSGADDCDFVVEIDNEGIAHLRFGDGELGHAPEAGAAFTAAYRVGNGQAGNVGAEAIAHVVADGFSPGTTRLRVRNPLPARGGVDPEPLAEARLFAPHPFRKDIERAIVADDYRTLAERRSWIQRASARLEWTGSWYEANVAVDPRGTENISDVALRDIERYLEQYRRIGHDLTVERAQYVPLDLQLHVCVLPDFDRGQVKAALLDVFGNRMLAGGQLGFFHPDQLSFGEGITLSRIVAAAQAVPGVECAMVERFQRLYESANSELANGILPLRNSEIAQLDNDPSFPERGQLKIVVEGGR